MVELSYNFALCNLMLNRNGGARTEAWSEGWTETDGGTDGETDGRRRIDGAWLAVRAEGKKTEMKGKRGEISKGAMRCPYTWLSCGTTSVNHTDSSH